MNPQENTNQRRGGIFLLLLLPYALLCYCADQQDIPQLALATMVATSALCLLLHLYRNRSAILQGIIGSIVLIAILLGCALIPVVGWIADVLIVLYALSSVLAALSVLLPLALRAGVTWAVFFITLLPEIHHPVASPLAYLIFCVYSARSLSSRVDPYGELILGFASIPLLMMVIASLGKMFNSQLGTSNIRIRQNVSGYTTRAGVNVADYTRTITKEVTTVTTALNPNAALTGSAAVHAANNDERD
jgi:hypothetical protein